MIHKNEGPAPDGNLGRTKTEFCIGVTPAKYQIHREIQADFPALYLARRFGLPLQMARIVAGLASIGERLA